MKQKCHQRLAGLMIILGMSFLLAGCFISPDPAVSTYELLAGPFPSETFELKSLAQPMTSHFTISGWKHQFIDESYAEFLTLDLDTFYTNHILKINYPNQFLNPGGALFVEQEITYENGDKVSHTWCVLFPGTE